MFEAQQTNMDVPYGDCYTCNIRWEVRAVATPDVSITDVVQQQPQQPGSAATTGAQQPADPSAVTAGGGAAATGAGPVVEAAATTAGAGVAEGTAVTAGVGALAAAAGGAVGGGGSPPQVHLDIYMSVPFSRVCVFKKVRQGILQLVMAAAECCCGWRRRQPAAGSPGHLRVGALLSRVCVQEGETGRCMDSSHSMSSVWL